MVLTLLKSVGLWVYLVVSRTKCSITHTKISVVYVIIIRWLRGRLSRFVYKVTHTNISGYQHYYKTLIEGVYLVILRTKCSVTHTKVSGE